MKFADILAHGTPQSGLSDEVNQWRLRNLRNLWRGARRIAAARTMGIGHVYGALFITVTRGNGYTEISQVTIRNLTKRLILAA